MRAAKSIDQLYEEVKGFDYVITNDAPLATALNAKMDQYRLEGFAYTPKALAGIAATSIMKSRLLTDLEVVAAIERDTGYDFKFIHSEVKHIRDIRRYSAEPRNYLSNAARKIYDVYITLPTLYRVMDIYDCDVYRSFMTGKKVAVIDPESFDSLDKNMRPLDAEDIDPFIHSESYDIRTINAIGNDRQIAGSIADLITLENCNDAAVVLDSTGPIADAVRAALYRRKIPFINSLDVKDLTQVRDYMEFLSLALDYETVRVKDVRELFSGYQTGRNKNRGKELTPDMDKYLLSRAPLGDNVEEVTGRLIDVMKNVRDMTFEQVLDETLGDRPQKTSVAILLDNMNLRKERVTPALVNRLAYAINNIDDLKHNEEIPENEKRGVLLADCKNSVYVDRSLVIYIGLDDSWEPSASGKEYVDKMDFEEKNANRLSILLQQGMTRIYAVKPVTKGKATIPCELFQTAYSLDRKPRQISTFEDICSEYVRGSWFRETPLTPPVMSQTGADLGTDTDWKFSKSSYNNYSDCPIKFMLSRLIATEDSEATVFGNCLHEFAELYFCYPEVVRRNGLAHYVERLEELYAGMSNECQRGIDSSKFNVYVSNLARYIDRIRPENVPLDSDNAGRPFPNKLMIEEGLDRTSSFTEAGIQSDLPMAAKCDACFGNTIIDYKSGKAKKPDEIIKAFTRRGEELSEFQAMIYLYVLSENTAARPCTFNLFFIGDNDIKSVEDPNFNVMENVRKVVLKDTDFRELAFGEYGTFRDEIGAEAYKKIIESWDNVYPVLQEMLEEGFKDSYSNAIRLLDAANLKAGTTNVGNMGKLLRKAIKYSSKPFINDNGCILIPADTMNDFVKQICEDHHSASEEKNIPIYDLPKGLVSCDKCNYRKACMKSTVDDEEEQ